MSNNKHYFIRRTCGKTGRVDYKKNMTVDGWVNNKAMCWQFSRSGAVRIVRDLQQRADRTNNFYQYTYDLVEGTLPYSGRDTKLKEE